MPQLDLSADDMLATTRSVRKRLDFSRPVEPEVIRECLELALQAPTGGNSQSWQFVVVTDAEKRKTLGDLYRKGWAFYRGNEQLGGRPIVGDSARAPEPPPIVDPSDHLAEHTHDAPALRLPLLKVQTAGAPGLAPPGLWRYIIRPP